MGCRKLTYYPELKTVSLKKELTTKISSQNACSSYLFGFNGKENDNEVKGSGNQQDYGLRIYDTRLGRFLSVDPLAKDYPWYTPYQFAGNKPIQFIDLDGAEEAAPMKNSEPTMNGYTSAQDNARAGFGGKSINDIHRLNTTIKLPTNNGVIYTTPCDWQKEFDKSVAPETRTMVTIDPVFRAISTGGIIYTTGVATAAATESVVASKAAIASTTTSTVLKVAEFGAKAESYYVNSKFMQIMSGMIYAKALTMMDAGPDPGMFPSMSMPAAEVTNNLFQLYLTYKDQYNKTSPSSEKVPAQNNTKAISNGFKSSNPSNLSESGTYVRRAQPNKSLSFGYSLSSGF